MDERLMVTALRNKAAEVRNVTATTANEDQTLRDAADLLRVSRSQCLRRSRVNTLLARRMLRHQRLTDVSSRPTTGRGNMTETNQTSRPVVGRLEASVSPHAWGPGQFVVVATFRYCLGRQTYIVQECADWLLLHWTEVAQPVRDLIQRELERAFEQDDRARAFHVG